MISARTAEEVHRDTLFDALLRKGCFEVDPLAASLLPDVERHEAQIRDMQACIHRLGESRNDVDLLPDVTRHET
jgi:hypothetical protein